MINRLLASALFAGFAAGLLAALLHFAFVQKTILLGEQYETGALVHFDGASGTSTPPAHSHDPASAPAAGDGHDHPPEATARAADPPAFGRNALTVLFTVLIYVAYALILVAGFGLADRLGRRIDARTGLLWGLAGFAAFQLAPAMGLAPELPGTIAADLTQRQIWWLGTVAATAGALALIGYGKAPLSLIAGAALLAAPHLIGAPQPDQFWGSAPPELGATFSARVLGVGLATWAVLGWLAGRFWDSHPAKSA